MTKILIDEATVKLVLEALNSVAPRHLTPFISSARAALREALAEQPAPVQQEPVAWFKWLPEGATHIARISVRTQAGGSLAMTTYAFKYDSAVLKVYVTDNDNEYPGWRDAKNCFFHLNFPVLPLYTTPQPAQRTWVGLTDGERKDLLKTNNELFYDELDYAEAIETKLKEKNNG